MNGTLESINSHHDRNVLFSPQPSKVSYVTAVMSPIENNGEPRPSIAFAVSPLNRIESSEKEMANTDISENEVSKGLHDH